VKTSVSWGMWVAQKSGRADCPAALLCSGA